jgi:hypothetical protein
VRSGIVPLLPLRPGEAFPVLPETGELLLTLLRHALVL